MPSPPRTVEAFAPAKINLTLHVAGQRDDGYHLLDSLVAFADIGDKLIVEPAGHASLTIEGPMADGVPTNYNNSVLKAAEFLGLSAKITLQKNLPTAAGIGGGTSDAAAAIRALCEAFEKALPDAKDLITLGADVPVCLTPSMQRMRGIGEDLSPLDGFPPIWAVLVNPGFPIATGQIFQSLPTKNNAPMPSVIPEFRSAKDLCAWLWQQRNDLEPAAINIDPRVNHVLKSLTETQSLLARMSGSGATCFGLYDSFANATLAQLTIEKANPGWWVRATQLS